jgi:Protein of unknown function (DUF2800)
MSSHAQLSPSSAVRWMHCPGSVALCKDLPDSTSSFAAEGTVMHTVAEDCLTNSVDAAAFVGRIFEVDNYKVEFTSDLALAVQDYVNYVRDVVKATGGQLLVEQKLPISQITGEADAHGTSDTVILAGDELIVIDLKGGRGVPVDAEGNPQLQIYALAALHEFGLIGDFKTVRMVIHQPRLGAVSEWVQTVEELEAFGDAVKLAAGWTQDPGAHLNPTDKGCKFCKAKATCPALRKEVLDCFEAIKPEAHSPDVDDAALLAQAMDKADLIEGWLKAIRAEVETRLMAGVPVPGYKVVQGKKGNRAWGDKAQAEALLKTMRVPHDQMYDYSVISPTSAEKLAKSEVIGPRQWPKVQALITQSEGRPSVAPESDKRPALVMSAVADDFEDVTATDLI